MKIPRTLVLDFKNKTQRVKASVKKSSKKLIAAGIIAAAAVLIFLGYPLLFCAVNFHGIEKEKNRVIEVIKEKGGEVYSHKSFVYTEMMYYGGYVISYNTEYVIIFKSDMTIDELNEKFPFQMISPLADTWEWNRNEKLVKRVKQPENKDGYYVSWFPFKPTVDETKATRLHTLFYASRENREDIKKELEFFK